MTKIIPKIHLGYKLVSSVEKGKKRKITTEFESIGIRGRHVVGKSQDLELNRPGLESQLYHLLTIRLFKIAISTFVKWGQYVIIEAKP